jgi:hypothetical protein
MASEQDEIDPETLQAQFDMSMSLIHNMVSGWVGPPSKTPTARANIDKELKNTLRKPPRCV